MEEPVPVDGVRLGALGNLLREAANVLDGYGTDWFANAASPAHTELAGAGDNALLASGVDAAYAFAWLTLSAVSEHAISLAELFRVQVQSVRAVSVDVIARSAVETAARTWWAMEPGLGTERRVARMLAHELHGAVECDGCASSLGWTPRPGLGISSQTELVRGWCQNLGFTCNIDKREVGDQRVPRPTTLVADLIAETPFSDDGKGVYQFGSGVSHGLTWALQHRTHQLTADGERRHRLVRVNGDHRFLEGAAAVVVLTFIYAARRVVQLTAWDVAPLNDYGQRVMDFLQTGPNVPG